MWSWRIMAALMSTFVACAPHGSAQPVEMKSTHELCVMSFNIRYGTAADGENHWKHRRQMVIDVIRRSDPDIIGLQEALRFQIDELREALPAYAEIGVGRADGEDEGEYAAILYRDERFDVREGNTFWFSDTPTKPGSTSWGNTIPRICTWARFDDVMSGASFYVYNIHLDHRSQESREKSVTALLEQIAHRKNSQDAVILTGDFNAGEENPAIRSLTSGAVAQPLSVSPTLRDTFRIIHPDAIEVGTFNAFKGETAGAKIDYIFVTPDVTVIDASIIHDHDEATGRWPSDHFPVVANLRLPAMK